MAFVIVVMAQNAHFIASKTFYQLICQCRFSTAGSSGNSYADHIQSALIKGLDPNNHREAKANAEYYLFRDNPYPIVIVECGFLSNPEELKALQDDGYQKKAVQCILDGIESYLADI